MNIIRPLSVHLNSKYETKKIKTLEEQIFSKKINYFREISERTPLRKIFRLLNRSYIVIEELISVIFDMIFYKFIQKLLKILFNIDKNVINYFERMFCLIRNNTNKDINIVLPTSDLKILDRKEFSFKESITKVPFNNKKYSIGDNFFKPCNIKFNKNIKKISINREYDDDNNTVYLTFYDEIKKIQNIPILENIENFVKLIGLDFTDESRKITHENALFKLYDKITEKIIPNIYSLSGIQSIYILIFLKYIFKLNLEISIKNTKVNIPSLNIDEIKDKFACIFITLINDADKDICIDGLISSISESMSEILFKSLQALEIEEETKNLLNLNINKLHIHEEISTIIRSCIDKTHFFGGKKSEEVEFFLYLKNFLSMFTGGIEIDNKFSKIFINYVNSNIVFSICRLFYLEIFLLKRLDSLELNEKKKISIDEQKEINDLSVQAIYFINNEEFKTILVKRDFDLLKTKLAVFFNYKTYNPFYICLLECIKEIEERKISIPKNQIINLLINKITITRNIFMYDINSIKKELIFLEENNIFYQES